MARTSLVVTAFAVGLLLAGPASAGQVWFGVSALDFGYKEFDDTDGTVPNREDGWLPGLVFGYREDRNRWFGHLDASFHWGEVDYDGETQDGVAARTDTDERIVDVSYRFGYWFGAEEQPRVAPYAGLGYRNWRREIQDGQDINGRPVQGLLERYHWAYLVVGVEANLRYSEMSEWGLDLRLTRTVDAKMELDGFPMRLNDGTVILVDDATFDLGERTGGKAIFYWRYHYGSDASVEIAPFYEQWDIGRSPDTVLTSGGNPAGVAFEPRSETRNYGVSLSIKRDF